MLIGFHGGMGVGKSTAIQALKDFVFPGEVHLVKFAQPLYDMQEFVYRRISSVHVRPETFIKDRKLLQWLGTEWGRDSISTNLWVDIWKAAVTSIQLENPRAVIVCDDVRFDNEGETLKSMGGHTIKIVSNRAGDRINTQAGIANHKSEAGIRKELLDFVVDNNDTVAAFEERLVACFKELKSPSL